MSLVRRYGDTDFVTALRAVAALLVVLDHTDALQNFGWLGANITLAAKHGVEIFFVISGFTIATTFQTAPSYGHYLTRRLLRIAPPYYVAIIAGFILASDGLMQPMGLLSAFGGALDLRNLGLHLVFLSDFDWRIADSILGVEWTIPIEVFWYVLLPFVILRLRNLRSVIVYTLAFIAFDLLVRVLALRFLPQGHIIFVDTFVAKYGYYFLAGILAFRIRRGDRHNPVLARFSVYAAPALIFAALVLANNLSGALTGLGTFLLVAFYRPAAHPRLNRIFCSRPLLFFGSISFSIYLTHKIVIMLWERWGAPFEALEGPLYMLVVLCVTVLLSALMYRWIEQPSNRFGKRIADRMFSNTGRRIPA